MRTIIRDNYTPKNGDYHEVILIDEAQNEKWIFDCDGVFTPLGSGEQINVVNSFGDSTTDAISQKFFTDTTYELQDKIDEIKNNPDVVDIVDTYADLQNYDTSSLGDKDVIRVLTDENHDNESTYYRWDKSNNQWVFIGAVEGYYTKAQTDTLLAGKQDTLTAGANITINNNEISATDTTYNNFVGTDGVDPGVSGLVPAPATTDAGKYLKADGTWGTVNTEQSDWAENDSTDPAYIKNRTHYTDTVTEGISEAATTSVGPTPDAGYVWLVEQLVDYKLSDVLDASAGDTVYLTITYSVAGTIKSDSAKFTVAIEQGEMSLDSDAEAGNRWRGAYVTEISGNTTVRWPVSTTDATSTVYITEMEYEVVRELDAKYIPVDGDTVIVNANGELEANVQGGPTVVQTTGTSTTDVMSQNATTSMIFADPATRYKVQIGSATTSSDYGIGIGYGAGSYYDYTVAIGYGASVYAANGVAIGRGARSNQQFSVAILGTTGATHGIAIGSGAYGGYTGASYGDIAIGVNAIAGRSGQVITDAIALGRGAQATRQGELNIADETWPTAAFNGTKYRLISGVYDPQDDHDAATKGYVDTAVAGAGASAFTNIEWNNLWT